MTQSELSLEEVYINLLLISKIEIGNKLILNDNYITIDTSMIPSITRKINSINRDDTIKFISHIINTSFEYLKKDNLDKQRLLTHLQLCLNGLNNIKQTYVYDKLVQAKIDVIIENINVNNRGPALSA